LCAVRPRPARTSQSVFDETIELVWLAQRARRLEEERAGDAAAEFPREAIEDVGQSVEAA